MSSISLHLVIEGLYWKLTAVCVTCNHFQDTVGILLKHKADINARDRYWQTPLHVAAANNAVLCADNLIPLLPNINVTDRGGRTSLHHAAYNGHHEVVEFQDFVK